MKSTLRSLKFKIVIADLSDKRYLEDILKVLDAYKCDDMGQSPPYNNDERKRLHSYFFSHPTVMVFLLYVDNQVAGGSVCFTSFSTFSVKTILNIHDLCILKQYRGNGYGTELMKSIIINAKELDCSKVTLEVREDNCVAKKLYSSLGFMESTPVMNFWHKSL